jgi:hypothetical protein
MLHFISYFITIIQANITYSYALELRPLGELQGGFQLPVKYIEDTVREAWYGINAMLTEIKGQSDAQPGNEII